MAALFVSLPRLPSPRKTALTLTRFETRVGFVNHVDATFATHYAAVLVPRLGGFQRVANLHDMLSQ